MSHGYDDTVLRWRGRLVVTLSDEELATFKNRPAGTRGEVHDVDASVGKYVWLCHNVEWKGRRVGWTCAAVVMKRNGHFITVMLIGPATTNASF